ncbi:MAG: hypothetical protein PVG41_16845, partial [Desulfobacteraceae bacterium]
WKSIEKMMHCTNLSALFFGRELAYCYMFSIIKEIFFDGTRMDSHDDVLQYINYRTIGAIPAKEVR